MRGLELSLILACAGYFVRSAGSARLPEPWPLVLSVFLVALLLSQLVLEGWRLAMLPVYALVLAASIENYAPFARTPAMRFTAAAVALVILTLCTLAALLHQQLTLSAPTGPLTVGVAELPAAPRAPGTGGPENLPAPVRSVWYPGTAPRQTQAWRISAFLAERFAHRLKAVDRVPAITNLTPSADRYPVLVYVGGWPEDSVQNRSLICELVSRGFVVVSLQYPRTPIVERPMAFYESDARFQQSVDLTDERARIYARDASTALNDLSRTPAYARSVDLQRAGVFGYSFGGAVAAQATRLDPRFRAAVNIDGRHYAEGRMQGVEAPYLFVGEVLVMPTEEMLKSPDAATRYEARADLVDYTQLARNLRRHGGIQASIEGTAHPNFSDDVLRSPLNRLSGGGSIDPTRALAITQALVVGFFETRLPARSSDWLTRIPQQFPETRIQQWQAVN